MDRVNELTKDCFNAILEFRALGDRATVSPQVVHRRLVTCFEKLSVDAQSLDVQEQDALDMTYALVALADEIALSKSEAIRTYWVSQSLQLKFFNENSAGEGFFTRLKTLRTDPRRIDTLRVFYLCLLFGFQGSYAVQGDNTELVRLQESLRVDLARAVDFPEALSPSATAGDEPVVRGERRRLHIWLGLAALAASFALYIGLRIALDHHLRVVVERSSTSVATDPAP
jgi:type VI secretion system protein ImpK